MSGFESMAHKRLDHKGLGLSVGSIRVSVEKNSDMVERCLIGFWIHKCLDLKVWPIRD